MREGGLFASARSPGSSSRQGGHHVAQNTMRTAPPRFTIAGARPSIRVYDGGSPSAHANAAAATIPMR